MGKIYYIKILDNEVAETLEHSGFFCTKEKINDNQDVYVFEKTDALMELIKSINPDKYQSKIYIEDSKLFF